MATQEKTSAAITDLIVLITTVMKGIKPLHKKRKNQTLRSYLIPIAFKAMALQENFVSLFPRAKINPNVMKQKLQVNYTEPGWI